jgi:hypothetical protein
MMEASPRRITMSTKPLYCPCFLLDFVAPLPDEPTKHHLHLHHSGHPITNYNADMWYGNLPGSHSAQLAQPHLDGIGLQSFPQRAIVNLRQLLQLRPRRCYLHSDVTATEAEVYIHNSSSVLHDRVHCCVYSTDKSTIR